LLETVDRVDESLAATLGGINPGPELDLALVGVLRPLHRILYTNLGPYHPDPAVTVGYLPGLSAVSFLPDNEPATDLYRFALTTLQREYPRILEALDLAQEEAEELLEVLERG
jgi:hypothetical protein